MNAKMAKAWRRNNRALGAPRRHKISKGAKRFTATGNAEARGLLRQYLLKVAEEHSAK